MYYNNKNKSRLFTKVFSVDDSLKNRRVTLHFEGDGDEIQIRLNGRVVLEKRRMHDAPFRVDVTDAVNYGGSNTLALITYPSKRLSLRDIFLESRPKGGIQDVLVTPSFRQKNLLLQIAADTPSATVSGSVLYLGQPVLNIPAMRMKSGTGSSVTSWSNPVLWSPENPQLLRLNLTMSDAAGNVIDKKSVRFGFRELWVSGSRLMFNGSKRIFRAVAMNGGYSHDMVKDKAVRDLMRRRKALGVCFLRHVYQGASYSSIADEEGLMMAQGVMSVAHSYATAENLQNDKLWKDKDIFSKKIIKNLYNHPSIVEWYVSNEFSESKTGETLKLARRRLIEANKVVRAADPLRLIGNGCDLDLAGTKQRYSTHYPIDVGALREIDVYTPDACLWHYADRPLTNGMMVPSGLVKRVANVRVKSPIAWGTKPIQVDEFGWNIFYNPPGGYMQLFGDNPISSVWEMKESHHRVNAMFNAGHREAEAALYVNWDHIENNAYRFVPVIDIQLWDQSHDWYENSSVSIPYNIFNETLAKKNSRLKVTLENDSRRIDIFDHKITLQPMGIVRRSLRFTAPAVAAVEKFAMHYVLSCDSEIVVDKTVNIAIYPHKRFLLKSDRKILVYDPERLLDKIFSNLALEKQNIKSFSELKMLPRRVLLVADNALNGAVDDEIRQIEEYVSGGGRVLVMQQKDVRGLFGMNTTEKISSIAFKRGGNHPAVSDFIDDDFKYWYKGHVVSRYDYQKPKKTAGVPLLDSGSGIGGLEYTPLYMITEGRGVCYLSQMNIIDSYATAPVADKLLRSLLSRLAAFTPQKKRAGIYVEKDSSLEKILKRVDIRIDRAEEISSCDTLFCDAEMLSSAEFRKDISEFLKGSGIIYFKNIDFTNIKLLSEVLGVKISTAKNDLPFIRGRELILRRDPILDGLSQADFFWRRWLESENAFTSFRADKDLLYPSSKLQIYVSQGIPLLYPNSLVKLKVGAVTVYLDSLQWDSAPPSLEAQSFRIAKTLLYNLGAVFNSSKIKPLNMSKLKSETISLQNLLNRSKTDSIDDDGKGGWNDQGSENDTRGFPSGSLNFNGIQFVISGGSLNCAALYSKFRRSDLPRHIVIPINKKAAALAFLHTSAWTGAKDHGAYIVHYADGTSSEIKLIGGKTLRDFCDPHPDRKFQTDPGIDIKPAYTYKNGNGVPRTLFQLVWTNPHPDRSIRYVKFETTGNAVMALFAVTALVENGVSASNADSSDPAAATGFYNAGLKAYKARNYAEAIKKFRQAIAADKNSYSSYLLLGDIYKSAKKYDKAEDILIKLLKTAPHEIEAYTKLGEIYEAEGRKKEALEIYRKSFRIDRNQPWLMHSIERLKNEVK
jgi:predicted negative regulator of RcsB-dependent stress response